MSEKGKRARGSRSVREGETPSGSASGGSGSDRSARHASLLFSTWVVLLFLLLTVMFVLVSKVADDLDSYATCRKDGGAVDVCALGGS